MTISTAAERRLMLQAGGETVTLADLTTPTVRFNTSPTDDLGVSGVHHEVVGEDADLSSVVEGQNLTHDATSLIYKVVNVEDNGVGFTVLRLVLAS